MAQVGEPAWIGRDGQVGPIVTEPDPEPAPPRRRAGKPNPAPYPPDPV